MSDKEVSALPLFLQTGELSERQCLNLVRTFFYLCKYLEMTRGLLKNAYPKF